MTVVWPMFAVAVAVPGEIHGSRGTGTAPYWSRGTAWRATVRWGVHSATGRCAAAFRGLTIRERPRYGLATGPRLRRDRDRPKRLTVRCMRTPSARELDVCIDPCCSTVRARPVGCASSTHRNRTGVLRQPCRMSLLTTQALAGTLAGWPAPAWRPGGSGPTYHGGRYRSP